MWWQIKVGDSDFSLSIYLLPFGKMAYNIYVSLFIYFLNLKLCTSNEWKNNNFILQTTLKSNLQTRSKHTNKTCTFLQHARKVTLPNQVTEKFYTAACDK